uniref:Uncharacterized protein n=1 Tax=Cacopsylla melanoneura TaxID=428564 RepID=A0A8D8ZB63_9HEMI
MKGNLTLRTQNLYSILSTYTPNGFFHIYDIHKVKYLTTFVKRHFSVLYLPLSLPFLSFPIPLSGRSNLIPFSFFPSLSFSSSKTTKNRSERERRNREREVGKKHKESIKILYAWSATKEYKTCTGKEESL